MKTFWQRQVKQVLSVISVDKHSRVDNTCVIPCSKVALSLIAFIHKPIRPTLCIILTKLFHNPMNLFTYIMSLWLVIHQTEDKSLTV